MAPVTQPAAESSQKSSPNVGLIVGVCIAGIAVLCITGFAISFALARRRKFQQNPHRVSDVSGLHFEARGLVNAPHYVKRGTSKEGMEHAGLLEEANFEAALREQGEWDSTALYRQVPKLNRPSQLKIDVEPPESVPRAESPRTRLGSPEERLSGSPFLVARTPSPLLRNLPPLLIPGRPQERSTPPPEATLSISQPHTTQSSPATSGSVYSENSASTAAYRAFMANTEESSSRRLSLPVPTPPVPALPAYVAPLPAHLQHHTISRSDSRATVQRGDTRAVKQMLKARARRLSIAAAFDSQFSRNSSYISRIEQYGSIDDEGVGRLQGIPEALRAGPEPPNAGPLVELTGAFKTSIYSAASPASSISSKHPSLRSRTDGSISERTVNGHSTGGSTTTTQATDAYLYPRVVIQPLKLTSRKAKDFDLTN